MATGTTGTYAIRSQSTTAVTGTTGQALSKEAAQMVVAATGPTGSEVHIWQTEQVAASGPTGTYRTTWNRTDPATGATLAAMSHDDAADRAAAAGPTGPGAGLDIRSVIP